MSMSPDNPFDNPNSPGYAQAPPPAKKSSAKFWLIGCGVTGLLGVFVCCGGGLLMTQFGMSMLAAQFQNQLEGNPVIVEHIGEIESMNMSWGETMKAAQSGDGQELAFAINGSKGSGTILVVQDKSGDGSGIQSATLVLADGSRHPIELVPTAEEIDMDAFFDEGDVAVPQEFDAS